MEKEEEKKDADIEFKDVSVDSEGNFNFKVELEKGENAFGIVANNEDETGLNFETIIISRKMSQEERDTELKATAKSIPFKDLFRNIDENEGEKIYYTGEVIQVMGDGKALSTMRVDITKGSYGIWTDTVLVNNFDFDSSKILEDDIIKFWGTVDGEESYETIMGGTVSLPKLSADIVELVQ